MLRDFDTCLRHSYVAGFGLCVQVDITDRTMSDGSLSRILLQPINLNPALPPSELLRVRFDGILLSW